MFRAVLCLILCGFVLGGTASSAQTKWKYLRSGNAADSAVTPKAGFALMGGGAHQEAAFLWLCQRANGGDFLVLSARDDDAYLAEKNREIQAICPLNSVATLSFFGREDSSDPKVIEIISHAEAIFLNGGDQADYVRFWQDTPVEEALNRHITAGKPIGGSSAGLAVLGKFSFSSLIDTIHSPEALANPYGNEVTLTRDFLHIPLLDGTITDTHFAKRDRMGRLLVFMARILEDGWATKVRAIAVNENAALLVEIDGSSRAVGGPVYFLDAAQKPEVCSYREPLTFHDVRAQRLSADKTFQLNKWAGEAESYSLSVIQGTVKASDGVHSLY